MLKKILIVVLVLIILVAGAFAYLYFTQNKTGDGLGEGITLTDFFPFGQSDQVPVTTTETPTTVDNTPVSTTPTQLRQIYAFPVAGAGIFASGSDTLIRFIEQSTGNIYETKTNTTLTERITNTTIPKVTEALFVTKDTVLLRSLRENTDVIETMYGNIGTSSVAMSTSTTINEFASLNTSFLFPGIKQISVAPNKNRLFYLTQFATGAIGTLSNLDGSGKSTLVDSPIREWTSQWATTSTLTLTTKPSYRSEGFLYFVNTTTGKQQKIIPGVVGLTTLTNPRLNTVLYSQSNQDGSISLYTWNVASSTGAKAPLSPTFPEKCVWGKKNSDMLYCAVPTFMAANNYPDAWYKGLVAFTDNLWVTNTKTGETKLLVNIKDVTERSLDVINPSIDENDSYILFKNKTDGTLWGYAI